MDVTFHLALTVVMVNCEVVYVPARNRQNGAVPFEIVVARGDDFDRRVDRFHFLHIAVEIVRISSGIAVAANPVPPYLVPDFPEPHVKWLRVAVRGTDRAIS